MQTSLAKALWNGPLPDPGAPAAVLAQDLDGGLPYGALLSRLRQLARHGLPMDAVLARALSAHPGSIDLALVAVQAETDSALDLLANRVAAQNRRRAALAWALWSRGQADAARAALTDLNPASDTYDGDRAARAELAILAGADPGSLDGPRADYLSLLHLYRSQGAAALARRVDTQERSADPALWSWLIDTFVNARDFTRARSMLDRFAAQHGPSHEVVRAQRIRLALDCEEFGTARQLLNAEPDADRPWLWPSRRLGQHMRCLIAECADGSDRETLRQAAAASGRIDPRNGFLAHLRHMAELMTDDWQGLDRRLRGAHDATPEAADALARIGLPDAALDALEHLPPGPPDATARLRLRRAELQLMRGAPEAAEAVLGPAPDEQASRPGDAYWRSEIALVRRDPKAALAILTQALERAPTQMGLVLNLARAQFMAGDFALACATLDRFRSLKIAQLGSAPEDDLRDKITADAAQAKAEARAETDSPGLAARALAMSPPAFAALREARIPWRLAHYWEGPTTSAVQRGLRVWGERHPTFDQRLFDPATASVWLARHAPMLCDLFLRQRHPATRADLFRLAWITHEGGIFADLDEYPRAPVTDWLREARAVLVIEQGYGTVANNFLAAEPGLPLFHRALARVTRALAETDVPYPWWHSGPAQLTPPALEASRDRDEARGLRFLCQMSYNARVSTNLPFPHKRSADHWR